MPARPLLEDQVKFALEKNKLALAVYGRISADFRFVAGCEMANSVAVNRLGYNDHGLVHVGITAVNALRIFELLDKGGVAFNYVSEKHGTKADAQVVVLLGALLHDIGNSISRDSHNFHGVTVAKPILVDALARFYQKEKLQKMILSVLGCVFEHDESVNATSIEAGLIKAADGMDCEHGRARIPYKMFGNRNIHALSALSITKVEAVKGERAPVLIRVFMQDKAGLFQVENVLTKKIESSGPFARQVEVEAVVDGKSLKKFGF